MSAVVGKNRMAHASTGGPAIAVWLVGICISAAAIGAGILVEDQLATMPMWEPAPVAGPFERIVPFVFGFGFPFGIALCALAVQLRLPRRGVATAASLGFGLMVVFAPILVSVLAGRELVSVYFGTGGVLIALCAASALLLLGRIRDRVADRWAAPIQLVAWAVACLTAAAWNLCGSAAMPGHLLFPDTLTRLGSLPIAIGQMKTVMALLLGGSALLLVAAALVHSRLERASHDPAR